MSLLYYLGIGVFCVGAGISLYAVFWAIWDATRDPADIQGPPIDPWEDD